MLRLRTVARDRSDIRQLQHVLTLGKAPRHLSLLAMRQMQHSIDFATTGASTIHPMLFRAVSGRVVEFIILLRSRFTEDSLEII